MNYSNPNQIVSPKISFEILDGIFNATTLGVELYVFNTTEIGNFVKGGTFNKKVASYEIASGYKQTKINDYKYVVKKSE